MRSDVVIAGAGPAGLSAAVAFAREGASVTLLGGDDVPWVPGYGVWADRFEALGYGAFLGPIWADAEVVLDEGPGVSLGRRYARVAKVRLRRHLLELAAEAGVRVLWRRGVSVAHDSRGCLVEDDQGGSHQAALLLDASGARSTLLRREGEASMFQAAFGQVGEADHGWRDEVMTFMDLRTDHVRDALGQASPSFLYVKPLGGRRVFVEETSLVRAPAMPFSILRARLRRRLARLGVPLEQVEHTEMCLIPMDLPLPDLGQRVLGLGAAASFVHPATGYQLCRSLAAAPRVARVVTEALGRGVSPEVAARDGWAVLWPEEALKRRELLLFGARLLAGLGSEDHRAFFGSFFRTPPSLWASYLSDEGSLADTVRAMAAMLCAADARTRFHLLRSGAKLPPVLARVTGGAL